mgnify:CR=1 FL=1
MSEGSPKITDLDYQTVGIIADALRALAPDTAETGVTYVERETGQAVRGVKRYSDAPHTIIVKEASLEDLTREAARYGL